MAVAIPRHYVLLDEAICRHGGVRPVEQGEGDSVVGAFSRASDAVAAALVAQRALAAEPWPDGAELRVRMAVHTGEARVGAEGSYVGHALNRAARLRAIGHGGQVLLSSASAMLAVDRLPAGATLIDMGVHRLKDLGRPEQVWQLAHPDLSRAFPSLRSLDVFRQNLPAQVTPLIGRKSDTSDVAELIQAERLVTLTGSAGVGKTRLALAVAADVLDSFQGGVWWVELAALSDGDAVGRAALAAIGAPEIAGSSASWQLAVALGAEHSLLILDNCEHLVTSCAELVPELLGLTSSVSVLTTSREPLGVPGEITWRVPSLGCPEPERSLDLSGLSQYDAVVLFVDRARRARASFVVTEANAPAIAQICYRLDGIPLALELAATRCRQMSAERICTELDDRFRLLTGGARTLLARQQTLAASLDWSHERLDGQERQVFRRLGVFSGVFPLEAAEAVVGATGELTREQISDVVGRLVDKSLVVAIDGPAGEPRYRLLESLRAYALDRARAAGELTVLRDAHARWWTDWLEPSFPMPAESLLDEVKEFHDNLEAALAWSTNDPPIGLRLLRPLARVWEQVGRSSDAMPAVDRLLSQDNAERHPAAWLEAADSCCALVMAARGPEAWSGLVARIESVATSFGDDYHFAIARRHRGGVEEAQQVRDLAHERGDHYLAASASIFLALCAAEDDPAAAEMQLAESASVARAAGSAYLREEVLVVQAMAARCTGDLRRCIELGRAVLDSRGTSRVVDIVGPMSFAALLARDRAALRLAAVRVEHEQRRAPGAVTWVEQVTHRLALLDGAPSRVDPDLYETAHPILPTFGTLWLECREAIDAREPEVALEGARMLTRPVPHGHAVLAAVEAAVTGDAEDWHHALLLAVDHNLRLIAVDALEGLALAAIRDRKWVEAVRMLARAERLRDETAYRWRFRLEQDAVDRLQAAAHRALDEHELQRAVAAGRNLDWRVATRHVRNGQR